MQNCPPPYRPFRGAEPPHFVERADDDNLGAQGLAAAAVAAWARGPADPRFHRLVVSAPAMGKSALLRALGRQAAKQLGWAVALHRCQPKERALGGVTAELLASVQHFWAADAAAIASAVLAARVNPACLSSPGAEPSWDELRQLLVLVGCFARRRSRGLLVAFDDADRLSGGEVEAIGHLARGLARDGLPVSVVLSGSPQLAERYRRAGNFSGVVWPTHLDCFDEAEAREALVVPANDRGVDLDEQALELLCAVAGGSPLEVQRLGFAAWSAARGAEVISVAHAEQAIDLVAPELAAKAS
ncbi:MAG: ATP-binding protein [Acidimicrobiales bacterium]